jgi:hypothetical protein
VGVAAAGGVLLYLGMRRAERSGDRGAASPAAPSVMILPSLGPGGYGASAVFRF